MVIYGMSHHACDFIYNSSLIFIIRPTYDIVVKGQVPLWCGQIRNCLVAPRSSSLPKSLAGWVTRNS